MQSIYPSHALDVPFSDLIQSENFAHQLCCLHQAPTTANKNEQLKDCIGWLMMTLCRNRIIDNSSFPRITKKIRDEAIAIDPMHLDSKNGPEHFQRSDYYMSMKVLLQLNLTQEMGTETGKFVYKIIMLRFITKLCAEFGDVLAFPVLKMDLMTQLVAKIARRIEKLSGMMDMDEDEQEEKLEIKEKFVDFYQQTIETAKTTISNIRIRIDNQIHQLQENYKKRAQLQPLIELDFDADINQKVEHLRAYLNERNVNMSNNTERNLPKSRKSIQKLLRHRGDNLSLDRFQKGNNEIENQLQLCDIENAFLYNCDLHQNRFDCAHLHDWFVAYSTAVLNTYADDPLGISRMMLVRLKLFAMIDRLARHAHPLLDEHRIGINTAVFDILLLPQLEDMKIVHQLRKYFDERDASAKHPGLIEKRDVLTDSFAVRFVEQNHYMQMVRQGINAAAEIKLKEKETEWKQCRSQAQELRVRIGSLVCTEPINLVPHLSPQHRMNCFRCMTAHDIDNLKIVQFKHPLPNNDDLQNVIVFELCIPIEVAILRDALHAITKFGQRVSKSHIRKEWRSMPELCEYIQDSKSIKNHVTIGTSVISSPALCHIDDHDSVEHFILTNDSDCIYVDNSMELCPVIQIDAIKKMCTLSVEPESPYAGLQWTLASTNHTENETLSRQSECPRDLSLLEFKNFGTLRADGHRLQLRKLYAMLENVALSFDQLSVLSLVLQTIWEAGPCGGCSYITESHEDFTHAGFASIMIMALRQFVNQQADNWAHPTKLLVAVLIATRIFELNEENNTILDLVVKLLDEIRAILGDWTAKIQVSRRLI